MTVILSFQKQYGKKIAQIMIGFDYFKTDRPSVRVQ